MNTFPFRIAATATVAALAVAGLGLAQASAADPSLDAATSSTVSFMREEERLARDLYTALEAEHGGNVAPFSNIRLSEQQHFDAVGTLLDRFGLDDPSVGLQPGDYAFDDLDALYKTLFEQGKVSLAEGYQAGIRVEEEDIADLRKAIEQSQDATVDRVLSNLLSASENHLAAFQRAASGNAGGQGGAGNGQRQRMGQGRWQDDQVNGATQAGQGRGAGRQGAGMRANQQDRPADCPLA